MRQLIILLSLVIAGCSAEHSRNATLQEAERLINQHPDSARNLLASINTDSLTTEADSAYYGLLFTEAVHAGGIVMGDDSLIARSHTYYEKHHDEALLIRSELQHGRPCTFPALQRIGRRERQCQQQRCHTPLLPPGTRRSPTNGRHGATGTDHEQPDHDLRNDGAD